MPEEKKPAPVVEKHPIPPPMPEKKAEKKDEKQETVEQAQKILQMYGGLEAQIPHDSEYWGLMNKYRALLAKEQEK